MEVEKTVEGINIKVKVMREGTPDHPRHSFSMGRVELGSNHNAFLDLMKSEFGDDMQTVVDHLASGEMVHHNGKFYLGVERYQHSHDVLAICKEGNFPDRRWNVSPIVGFYTPDQEVDCDVISKADLAIENWDFAKATEIIKERAGADMEIMNRYLSGDVWYGVVEIQMPGREPIIESVGNIYGYKNAIEEMKEAIAFQLSGEGVDETVIQQCARLDDCAQGATARHPRP